MARNHRDDFDYKQGYDSTIRRLFSQLGNPKTLVSDNVSQITPTEFEDFCRLRGVVYVRPPPFHPQSNGQAERFVDTFKRAIRKLKTSKTTTVALQKFLLVYRQTLCPSSHEGPTSFRRPISLLTTPRTCPSARNNVMEEQFNGHQGARSKSFDREDEYVCETSEKVGTNGHLLKPRSCMLRCTDGRFYTSTSCQLNAASFFRRHWEDVTRTVRLSLSHSAAHSLLQELHSLRRHLPTPY